MARPEPMAGSPPVLSVKVKGTVAEESRIRGPGVKAGKGGGRRRREGGRGRGRGTIRSRKREKREGR